MNEKLRELNAELEVLNENFAELARLKRYEHLTRQALTNVQQQLAAARQQFRRQMADVVHLEGLSLERLWHLVTGDLNKVLDQEERELVIAASTLKLIDDEVRSLARQLRKIQVKIRRFGDLAEEKAHLVQEKGTLLLALDDAAARAAQERFADIQDQLARKRDQLLEVFQAVAQADAVEDHLDVARRELATLQTWQPEASSGDPALAQFEKHNRRGQATRSLQKTQQALGRLERELTDLDQTLEAALDVKTYEMYTNGFLQGFYVDWLLQDRIEEAQWGLNGIEHFLEQVRQTLKQLRKQLARDIGLLELELQRLVESWT